MFKSKRVKELEAENEKLRKEVSHHKMRSALVEKAGLPKCKSTACYNCKYVSFMYNPGNGAMVLLGCGRDLASGGCQGYEHTDENKGPVEEMKYRLLSMAKDYLPDQEVSLSPPCVHLPQPPCHEWIGNKTL